MTLWIILATVTSTLLGGLFAIKLKDRLHLVLGLSAGTMLGVAFFDLIPESINLAGNSYGIEGLMLLTAAAFSIYMLIDRAFSLHNHEGDCNKASHNGRMGALALILHSFLDGLGVGLAFKVSIDIGWIVAMAVLAHNFSDGINTVSVILRGKNKRSAIKWLLGDAIAPAMGIVAAGFVVVPISVLGAALAIFAGLFIYISTSDLIPESHHAHSTLWTTLSTVLGLAAIYLLVNLGGVK